MHMQITLSLNKRLKPVSSFPRCVFLRAATNQAIDSSLQKTAADLLLS